MFLILPGYSSITSKYDLLLWLYDIQKSGVHPIQELVPNKNALHLF